MRFAGRTWRPKYESDSCILQLTSGCTYFPGTMLFDMASQGSFIPAGEKERIQELQILIENPQIRTHLFADSKSNFYPISAYLPKERESIVCQLQFIFDSTDKSQMEQYRNSLKSLE